MSKQYHRLPSELLFITDPYTAYCFNEACAYVSNKLDAGESPMYHKQYKNFHDLYAQFEKGGDSL